MGAVLQIQRKYGMQVCQDPRDNEKLLNTPPPAGGSSKRRSAAAHHARLHALDRCNFSKEECLQHLHRCRCDGRALVNLRQCDLLDIGVARDFAQHSAVTAAHHQHLLGLCLILQHSIIRDLFRIALLGALNPT